MSATDWDYCPKCEAQRQSELARLKQYAEHSYGKMEANEWRDLVTYLDKAPNIEAEKTLREDYSQGVCLSGQYYVRYRASCNSCSYEFKYEYEVQTDTSLAKGQLSAETLWNQIKEETKDE